MIHSPSKREAKMRRFVIAKLKEMGVQFRIDKAGNIYATKGSAKSYPCIVAHLDEVHSSRPKGFEICSLGDDVLFGFDRLHNKFCGIGADDKNGIWVAMKALSVVDTLKCAFFVGEEIGCAGSLRADMGFFVDCRFVVECDRKGSSDMVTSICHTELCSKEFITATSHEKFGYKPSHGMMTDVEALKQQGLKVSCINLSCGYYNPHTDTELTRISELKNCLDFVLHIISTCTEIYPHTPQPRRYSPTRWMNSLELSQNIKPYSYGKRIFN